MNTDIDKIDIYINRLHESGYNHVSLKSNGTFSRRWRITKGPYFGEGITLSDAIADLEKDRSPKDDILRQIQNLESQASQLRERLDQLT